LAWKRGVGDGLYTILGGTALPDKPYGFPGVSLATIAAADGASQTLLLGHKGMSPAYYNGTGRNDAGWAALGNSWEHRRNPAQFVRDTNVVDCANRFGSSHPDGMPVVFADGAVRLLNYDVAKTRVAGSDGKLYPITVLLWCYNDGRVLPSE